MNQENKWSRSLLRSVWMGPRRRSRPAHRKTPATGGRSNQTPSRHPRRSTRALNIAIEATPQPTITKMPAPPERPTRKNEGPCRDGEAGTLVQFRRSGSGAYVHESEWAADARRRRSPATPRRGRRRATPARTAPSGATAPAAGTIPVMSPGRNAGPGSNGRCTGDAGTDTKRGQAQTSGDQGHFCDVLNV
jgi:hypothetical protein